MASPRETDTRAYRIVSPKYPYFDGSGTHRWGSRWISPGRWVVHAAETYALAVLENLVHWQTSALRPNLVCVEVRIPNEIRQEQLDPKDAPVLSETDYTASRTIGDEWYDRGETAVLRVSSIDGIDVEFGGQFVDDGFDAKRRDRRTRRAIGVALAALAL